MINPVAQYDGGGEYLRVTGGPTTINRAVALSGIIVELPLSMQKPQGRFAVLFAEPKQ